MSAASVESSPRAGRPAERPLIIAAYLHGDPNRKRRVKVPPNSTWEDFLRLFYTRFDVTANAEIEIYDEKGIEIVSVDDLVENDILVVTEKRGRESAPAAQLARPDRQTSSKSLQLPPPMWPDPNTYLPRRDQTSVAGAVYPARPEPARLEPTARSPPDPPQELLHEHDPSSMGVPRLAHFIQSNSFGYYFLAEVENMLLPLVHGRVKKIHCIVKVPHCKKTTGSFQTFESEANLLRRIAGHKCMIAAPAIQILNFTDEALQRFYSGLPHHKQPLLRELFLQPACTEAYMYSLYGVTMATKIKSGLLPDKVLKYAFQLADVMHYLQQKGVIHQNLLPENIQVMSNDRVILCNFETAVQTDPTTCLLMVSRSVVAPSNQKGLAPEVISAFNRIETDLVDYSTQYPWNFGILSVVMATRQLPLTSYPNAYLVGGRVKYRSANYQALPDPSMYPGIFCKLLKRSMSCDPVRRPTLPQILSVMKKDSKIIAAMMGRRASATAGGSSAPPGQPHPPAGERNPTSAITPPMDRQGERGVDKRYPPDRPPSAHFYPSSFHELSTHELRQRGTTGGNTVARGDSLSPDHLPYNQAVRKRSKVDSRSAFPKSHPSMPRSHVTAKYVPGNTNVGQSLHEHQQRHQEPLPGPSDGLDVPHDGHVSAQHRLLSYPMPNQVVSGVDPFQPPVSMAPGPLSPPEWQAFGEEEEASSLPASRSHRKRSVNAINQPGTHARQAVPEPGGQVTKSHDVSSPGAFSDDFTAPLLPDTLPKDQPSHASLHDYFPQARPPSSSEGEMAISPVHDIPYQRLVASPSQATSQEQSLTPHGPDRERLTITPEEGSRHSSDGPLVLTSDTCKSVSPEGMDAHSAGSSTSPTVALRSAPQRFSNSRKVKGAESLQQQLLSKSARARFQGRTPGYKRTLSAGKTRAGSPLAMRRCFSDGEVEERAHKHQPATETASDTGIVMSGEENLDMDMDIDETSGVRREAGETDGPAPGLKDGGCPLAAPVTEAMVTSSPGSTEGRRELLTPDKTEQSDPVDQSGHTETSAVEVDALASVQPHETSRHGSPQAREEGLFGATQSEWEAASDAAGTPLASHDGALEEPNSPGSARRAGSQAMETAPGSASQETSDVTFPELIVYATTAINTAQNLVADYLPDNQSGGLTSPAVVANKTLGTASDLAAVPSRSTAQLQGAHAHASTTAASPSPANTSFQSERSHVQAPQGYMSPIPEASQECTSSQAQTHATSERMSLDRTLSTETEHQLRHRSVSPFHHYALTDRTSTSGSQGTASDQYSTPNGSVVAGVPHGQIGSPLLEPPSSDTSTTSRSQTTTASSEPTSLQARVSSSPSSSFQSHPLPYIPPPRVLPQTATSRQLHVAPAPRGPHEVAGTGPEQELAPASTPSAHPQLTVVSGVTRSLSPRSGSSISGVSNRVPSHASFPNARVPRRRERRHASGPSAPDYPKGHRISQDLEVMNLAIAGMDSRSPSSSQQQQQEHELQQQMAPFVVPRPSSAQTALFAGSPHMRDHARTPSADRPQSFRPITPAVTEMRSASADPAQSHSVQVATNSEVPSMFAPDGHIHSASGVHDERLDIATPPPPPLREDSYDYLPPYSPPSAEGTRSRGTQSPRKPEQDASLFPEPPPSYEQIFGKKQSGSNSRLRRQRYSSSRNRDASTDGASTTPPTTRPSSAGQRRLPSLANLFRRTRPRQVGDAAPLVSRRERGRESPATPQVPPVLPQGDSAAEYTASWVASYSRTPRPVDAILESQFSTGRDAASVVSAGSVPAYPRAHSHVSRAVSDSAAATSRQRHSVQPPIIPYRHPPPFPSLEGEQHQQGSQKVRRVFPEGHGSGSPGVRVQEFHHPRQGGTGHSGYRAVHVPQREGERQRPQSVILPLNFEPHVDISRMNLQSGSSRNISQIGRIGSRPASNLVAAASMSSSCFDILSPPDNPSTSHDRSTATAAVPARTPGRPSGLGQVQAQVGAGRRFDENRSGVHLRAFGDNANGNNTNSPSASASRRGRTEANAETVTTAPRSTAGDMSKPMIPPQPAAPPSPETAPHSVTPPRRGTPPMQEERVTRGRNVTRVRPASNNSGAHSSSSEEEGGSSNPQTSRLHRGRGLGGEALEDVPPSTPPTARIHSQVTTTTPTVPRPAPPPDTAGEDVEAPVPAVHDTTDIDASPLEIRPNGDSLKAVPQLDVVNGLGSTGQIRRRESVGQRDETEEIQIVEVTVTCGEVQHPPSTGSSQPEPSLLSSSKSCGHTCHSAEQELCCLCLRELQADRQHGSTSHQNCQFCDRRSTGSDEGRLSEAGLPGCTCGGGKHVQGGCPIHSRRPVVEAPSRSPGRNCSLM